MLGNAAVMVLLGDPVFAAGSIEVAIRSSKSGTEAGAAAQQARAGWWSFGAVAAGQEQAKAE
jgi:hypothetical protein